MHYNEVDMEGMYVDWKRLLASQVSPLPEDILKKKWAGDFDGALRAIEARLMRDDLPGMLRDRLTIERELIGRLPWQYPFDRDEALAEVRSRIADFSEREFDRYEAEGGIDFVFVGGQKRYFESIYGMLLDWDPNLVERAGGKRSPERPVLDQAIAEIRQNGELGYRIRVRHELRIRDEAFAPGETYRVHLPVPKPSPQQSNIEIIAQPGGVIAPEAHPQRTVFYERTLTENEPFVVEYAYDNIVRHMDCGALPVYPDAEPVTDADLGENPPHLCFTPYLRELARDVRGELTDPMEIARACYDFVTRHVTYSYLRSYVLVDDMAQYVALNLKGDCGAQSLLFIALLRINGIPARWQSCINAGTDSVGSHDWAWFHVEPFGWLPCDCSRGGGALKAGATERWNFFFGNLDPFRMVANSDYFREFAPPKRFLRNDPYDNQRGEVETDTRALRAEEFTVDQTLVSLERIR